MRRDDAVGECHNLGVVAGACSDVEDEGLHQVEEFVAGVLAAGQRVGHSTSFPQPVCAQYCAAWADPYPMAHQGHTHSPSRG